MTKPGEFVVAEKDPRSVAWSAFLAARIAYIKAPSDTARRRVQFAYLAVCSATGLSDAETADCMATMAERNDWPAIEMVAA